MVTKVWDKDSAWLVWGGESGGVRSGDSNLQIWGWSDGEGGGQEVRVRVEKTGCVGDGWLRDWLDGTYGLYPGLSL